MKKTKWERLVEDYGLHRRAVGVSAESPLPQGRYDAFSLSAPAVLPHARYLSVTGVNVSYSRSRSYTHSSVKSVLGVGLESAQCVWCKDNIRSSDVTLEHIIPVSWRDVPEFVSAVASYNDYCFNEFRGVLVHDLVNMVLAHSECNRIRNVSLPIPGSIRFSASVWVAVVMELLRSTQGGISPTALRLSQVRFMRAQGWLSSVDVNVLSKIESCVRFDSAVGEFVAEDIASLVAFVEVFSHGSLVSPKKSVSTTRVTTTVSNLLNGDSDTFGDVPLRYVHACRNLFTGVRTNDVTILRNLDFDSFFERYNDDVSMFIEDIDSSKYKG